MPTGRAYRATGIPRQRPQEARRRAGTAGHANRPGAPEGAVNNLAGVNQYSKKDEDNDGNSDINQTKQADTRKRSNKDPERIIARLKRDAATDPQAQTLLEAVTNRSIRPYAAAKAMGWVKPMRSIPVDSPEAAIRALLRAWP